MSGLGKYLIFIGLAISLIGIAVSLGGKIPWLGRLPGDIYIKKENFTFYFPIASSILISLVISLLFWLFRK